MNHSLFDPAAEREHPQPIFSTLLVDRSGLEVIRCYGEIIDYHLTQSAEIAQRIAPGTSPRPAGAAARILERKKRSLELSTEAPQMTFILRSGSRK